jgi:hypothetical protein
MAKETKDLYKIMWMTWDGSDYLIIQSCALNVDEDDVEDKEKDEKGKKTFSKKLTRITKKGSVKFMFRHVDSQAKVDKYVKDIRDGIRK